MAFKMLDIRKQRWGIPERKEVNEMSSVLATAYHLLLLFKSIAHLICYRYTYNLFWKDV